MTDFLNSEDINKSLEMWTICFQKMQFIITKCNTARLIDLLQDNLIIFMQLFVQFVKLFMVLRRPEDFLQNGRQKSHVTLLLGNTTLKPCD